MRLSLRQLCAVALGVAVLLASFAWNQARSERWPFRGDLPNSISWCERDYEGGRGRYDADVSTYVPVGQVSGEALLAPKGSSCGSVPAVLLVQHDGVYTTYGILGAP